MQYIAMIEKDSKSDFGVIFPDFPGCVSAGKTMEEAISNASEALDLHIEGMLEDGEALPQPSDISDIVSNSEYKDMAAIFVDAERASKTERINITLPSYVLSRIDNVVNKSGLSRSAYMVQATLKVLTEGLIKPYKKKLDVQRLMAEDLEEHLKSNQELLHELLKRQKLIARTVAEAENEKKDQIRA